MLEAFNELMADPASRAELVGGVVEALIFVIPAEHTYSRSGFEACYAVCATAPTVHASSSATQPTSSGPGGGHGALRTSSCRFELEAEAIDMAVELDNYREFLAILSSEIEALRQQIDEVDRKVRTARDTRGRCLRRPEDG